MENLDRHINDELEPTKEFLEAKQNLLNSLKQEPTEEATRHFSIRYSVDLESAKAALQERYQKEVDSVDHKEIALRLSNAMKIMSPKLMGLEFREREREAISKRAIDLAEKASDKLDKTVETVITLAEAAAGKAVVDKLNAIGVNNLASSLIELERQNEALRAELEKGIDQMKELKKLYGTKKGFFKRLFGG